MMMVEIDSSGILVEPLKDRTAEEMKRAYLLLIERLKRAGLAPEKHVMDNEVSEELRDAIENECKLELVPPGCHRRNVAEVAIKTFKAHFIAILAGLPTSFPLRLWDELLPQAELTVNILRPSHARPKVSAHTYLFGPFDFNRTPLAPIGCETQCHVKPGDRGTWEEHSVDGWFLGSSLDHYRAFRCYIKSTKARRVCDTVQFMHKHITQPALTQGNVVSKAAHDLIKALQGKQNWLGDEQKHDLKQLSAIFQDVAQRTTPDAPDETKPLPTPRVQPPRVVMKRPAELQLDSRVHLPRVEVQETEPEEPEEAPQLIVESGQNMPKRLQREIHALRADQDHADEPPARCTRSRMRKASSVSSMARAMCIAAAVANCCIVPKQTAAHLKTCYGQVWTLMHSVTVIMSDRRT